MKNIEENQYFNFKNKPGREVNRKYLDKNNETLINVILILQQNNINIQNCLNSLINQTFPYWKLSIIDYYANNIPYSSKDDCRIKVYKETMDKDNNILNKIIEDFESDFLFILNPKDVLDETILECSYWTLKTNLSATWCYTNYVIDEKELINDEFTSDKEKERNIVNSSFMIRKKAVKNLKIDSEWQFFIELLKQNQFPVKMNYYGTWNNNKETIEKIQIEENEIKQLIEGINYPVGSDYWFNTKPCKFEWNIKERPKNLKINLLCIFPWFRVGGADKFNYELISNLDKEVYDITIITTETCPYIWRQKFEKYADIFDLTSFLHKKYWSAFIHYIMKTRNINIVFNSNSYYGYYVIPWLKNQFPKTIFLDYLHAVNWNWRNGEYPTDSTAISRILDKTFVTSKQIKDVMKENMGRKKENVEIVYIGVDDEKFNKNNEEIVIDETLSINEKKWKDKKIILFCSRISKEKRPLLMIRILEKILKKRDDIILFVVGDGSELEKMRNLVKELELENNVIFFGMKEDVRAFYKLADVLVICSVREGITLTTYESLAMETPVVSAQVGGQSELIDESVGRLVRNIQSYEQGEKSEEYTQEEIELYVNAIEEIIDNPNYEKIAKNCRKKIEKSFTIKQMVSKIDNEFKKLIKEGSKVSEDIINNEELYSQYLNLHNEVDKRFYNNPIGGIIPRKIEKADEIEEKLKKVEIETENQIEKYRKANEEKMKIIEEKNEKIEILQEELNKVYNSKRWKCINKFVNILKFKK